MSRFYVHFKQLGGCDYTIACGQCLVALPETVQTMGEAEKAVLDPDGDQPYCLAYYSATKLNSVTIYEVTASKPIDLKAI